MESLTPYRVEIQVPELVVTGCEASNLVCSVRIKDAHHCMSPAQGNVISIDFEDVKPEDKLNILVLDESAEIGKFEMELSH